MGKARARGLAIGAAAPGLLAVLAGCSSGAEVGSTPTAATETPSWLFVMDAAGGTYDGESRTLTLTDTDPATVVFSDRPVRDAGRLSTEWILQSWEDDLFPGDPPNATVVVSDAADHQDAMVLELGTPTYGKDATVTFPATPVDGPVVGGQGREADTELPASFGDVAVFVDYTDQLCLNLSQCPDGQQVGATWGEHRRSHKKSSK